MIVPIIHKFLPTCIRSCCPQHDAYWTKYLRDRLVKYVAIFMMILCTSFCFKSYSAHLISCLPNSLLISDPAISLKSLSLWSCIQINGQSYLTSDLSVVCDGQQYVLASLFNIVFVLAVVVGWPAFMLWCGIFFFSRQIVNHISLYGDLVCFSTHDRYLRRVEKQGRVFDSVVEARIGSRF